MKIKNLFYLLLYNQIHLGHFYKRLNMTLSYYILGIRNNLLIFNVKYIWFKLQKWIKFFFYLFKFKQKLLLINDYKPYSMLIEFFLKKSFIIHNHAILSQNWICGLLTNFFEIFKLLKKYKFKIKNKKYFLLKFLKIIPYFIFLIKINEYKPNWIISECFKLNISSTFLVDSNQSVFGTIYPILSNNDSFGVVLFFLKLQKILLRKSYFTRFI